MPKQKQSNPANGDGPARSPKTNGEGTRFGQDGVDEHRIYGEDIIKPNAPKRPSAGEG